MGQKRTTGITTDGVSLLVLLYRELDWVYGGNWGLDKPFGFLVHVPSGVRSADVSYLKLLRLIGLELE